MKRIGTVIILAVVFAVAFWWFSRRNAAPPAPPPVAAVPVEDPKLAERRALFGGECAAAGVQWRHSGLGYLIRNEGVAPKPGIGARVQLNYTGRTKDGTVFDRTEKPREFLIGATIPGLSTALQLLGTGGKATVFIPPSLGYGAMKVMGLPPGSGLIFDVEVVSITP